MTDDPNFGWNSQSELFLVAEFEVDAAAHCLNRNGESIKLEPRAMALLLFLAQRPGAVVSREELEREVWRGMVVGYDALNNTVAKLRKAFNDDPKKPRVIQTVPKVGYKLIAEVGVSPSAAIAAEPPPEGTPHPSLERKLTAIFYADVVDYSRLTGLDEEGTHRALSGCLDLMTDLIGRYNGSVVHFAGDAILAEFPTVSTALSCAIVIQQDLGAHNEGVANDRRMQFRIGVNLGEVIVDRNDIYGSGVNVAARLEALAEPGCVCLSGTVFDAIGHTLPLDYSFLGERGVKNIEKPVRAYQARPKPGATLPPPTQTIVREAPAAEKPNRSIAIAAAAVLAVVAAGALLWFQPWNEGTDGARTVASPIGNGKPSIAVLPFENVSDDPSQGFYADGMTGDLITDLSKLSGLAVIARHSVFAYKNVPTPLDQIATELGVRYLLEGNVRRFDDKIRINVSLVDSGSARSVWSERYDGDETELFDLHNRVITNIVSALAIELTDQEQSLFARAPTRNLEAYDYYQRAEQRRLSAVREEAWYSGAFEAIDLYNKAMVLDPEFAEPHVGLAWLALNIWDSDSSNIMPGAAARKLAYDSASRVSEVDPDNPAAYSILARLQATEGQYDVALESSRRAIDLGPNDADAWAQRAVVLTYAGRHDAAGAALAKAFELNPKPPEWFHGHLARLQYFAGQYEDAAASLDKTPWFDYLRLMVYGQLGRTEDAKEVLDAILADTRFASLNWYRTREAHYRREEDMEHMLDGLRKGGLPEHVFGFEGRTENRLDTAALEQLTAGKAWRGVDNFGIGFVQQISGDGRIAFRNDTTLLVGNAWIKDDMFCVRFSSNVLGRDDCGYVYHNPEGTPDENNEYVRTAIGNIYYFSVEQ